MPTYKDVTARVRAFIDDMPNHYADDNFLLTYVNMAQGQLVSVLASNAVREALLTTSMFVPAYTTRIERWPSTQTLPNELPYSDAFAVSAPPSGWSFLTGSVSRSTGLSDPDGGTSAIRWATSDPLGFDAYTTGEAITPALSYFGSASIWLRTPDSDAPVGVRVHTGIADDNGPLTETVEYTDVSITGEWFRAFVSFTGKPTTSATTGSLRRFIRVTANPKSGGQRNVELYRAVVRHSTGDTPDVATAGSGVTNGRCPVLPGGIIVPDRLRERKAGDSSAPWTVMRGPVALRAVPESDKLLQWDWRQGGIDLGPARSDRELMIEYWGELQDGQLGANVLETELPISGSLESLAAITAGLVAQARSQHDAASRFGVMTESGGFSGAAGGLSMNLVNTINKAQQSEPVRRQPYFGVARYPGVSGNLIGGWPWNS